MPTEYFERRERALLGDRFDALYAAPQETVARGVTVSALRAAPEQFAALAQQDMLVDSSWTLPAKEYMQLYQSVCGG